MVESEAELTLFQALAEQTCTGPEALNKSADSMNVRAPGKYTVVSPLASSTLDQLRHKLQDLGVYNPKAPR